MIKVKTMYDLYNTSLLYQIEDKKKFIQLQTKKVEEYLTKMNEVASILSMYINYSDALNGKCKSLPDEVLAKNTTEIKYANMVLKHYYELRQPIEIATSEIRQLKKQQISYSIYKEIISLHNKKVAKYLVDTGKTYENKYLGTLKLVYRENTNAVVNWNESNKNKKELIEKGLIPYKKEDEEKALANGEVYNGVKWLVTGYSTGLLVVKWTVPLIVKELLNKDIHDFKYIPARGHYGIMNTISTAYTDNFNGDKYQKI